MAIFKSKSKTPAPSATPNKSSSPSNLPIQCIISVHGMGDPKFNSTLMPIAEQIVQAAYPNLKGDTLTLGGISGLTGADPTDAATLPCFALNGISVEGDPVATQPALLRPSRDGQNLYFADIFWSSITKDVFPKLGDSLPHWTECLLNRVARKRQAHDGGNGPWWVMDMLYLLRRTLVFAEKALAWRSKELTDVVIGQYLGDVQLYGEYAQCRGKAVRLFHETMARIHQQLNPDGDRKVEYTVIAHSLGTVLSMDALVLAHSEKYRKPPAGSNGSNSKAPKPGAQTTGPDFPGYDSGPALKMDWIDSVRAFVTLGSPIDKFLTLWWYNYLHLASTDWIRPRKSGPIRHYNFCDEQDPVGHRLDFARTAPGFSAIFSGDTAPGSRWNDVVYNHTPIPGWAHVSYWKDRSLFELIYNRIIVGENGAPQNLTREDWKTFEVYRRNVFTWILMIHYYLVPILCIGACHFSLTLSLLAEGWHSRALGMMGFVLSAWYGRSVMLLNIGWRRALKQDTLNSPELHSDKSEEKLTAAERMKRFKTSFLFDREKHSRNARASWWLFAGGSWALSLVLSALLWKDRVWSDLFLSEGMPVTIGSGVLITGILIILNRLSQAKDTTVSLPTSLKNDIAWGKKRELATVVFTFLPFALMSVPALRQPVMGLLSDLGAWAGMAGFSLKRDYLIVLWAVFQLSALGWAEVIWLHYWIKRRFTHGRKSGEEIPRWQTSFPVFAGDPVPAKVGNAEKPIDGAGGLPGPKELVGQSF